MSLILDALAVIFGLAVTVFSVVLGNLVSDSLKDWRKGLRLNFQVRQEREKLGFTVQSNRGNLTEARVRCNSADCEWETTDKGGTNLRKDIFAGDTPSLFYPFYHTATWIDAKDLPREIEPPFSILVPKGGQVRGAVLLRLIDIKTGKEIWSHKFVLGGDATAVILSAGNALPAELPLLIQMIAREIEEEKHYKIGLGSPLQVFDLDREKPIIRYTFAIRRKSWFSPKIPKGPLSVQVKG